MTNAEKRKTAMTRIDSRAWAGVALFVAVLAYVGCTTSTSDSASPSSASSRQAVAGAPGAAGPKNDPTDGGGKLAANLLNPTGVLIVSGERDGYNEPCGCSVEQLGGLIRLYDLVER